MDKKLLEAIEKGIETNAWIFIGKLSDGKVRTLSSFPEGSDEYLDLLIVAYGLATTPCDETCEHRRI